MFVTRLKPFVLRQKEAVQKLTTLAPCYGARPQKGLSEAYSLIVESFRDVPGLEVDNLKHAISLFVNSEKIPSSVVNTLRSLFLDVMSSNKNGSLVSLFFGLQNSLPEQNTEKLDLSKRRMVSATQLCHCFETCHTAVLNVNLSELDRTEKEETSSGNKIMVLVGDFFLVYAMRTIMDLRDNEVLNAFAKGVESFTGCDFHDTPDSSSGLQWWEEYNAQRHALLPSMFECSLLHRGLATEQELKVARTFGRNLAFALQASEDIAHFKQHAGDTTKVNPRCLPLMMAHDRGTGGKYVKGHERRNMTEWRTCNNNKKGRNKPAKTKDCNAVTYAY